MSDAVDLKKEERKVMRAATAAMVFALLSFAVGYATLPLMFAFPTDMADRLALAAQASIFILIWVVFAIGVVSHRRRKNIEDIRGSAFGPPSPYIVIWVAFLQNTLEQAVIAVGAIFALATLLNGSALAIIPVAVVLFGIGRVAFLVGYPGGAGSRAFGMALTMTPALFGYFLTTALIGMKIAGY